MQRHKLKILLLSFCVLSLLGSLFAWRAEGKIIIKRLKYKAPENGLVGYWPLDGDTMAYSNNIFTFYDQSGNGNHATSTNGIFNSLQPGKNGQAWKNWNADGVGNHLSLGTAPTLDNLPTGDGITITLWFNAFAPGGSEGSSLVAHHRFILASEAGGWTFNALGNSTLYNDNSLGFGATFSGANGRWNTATSSLVPYFNRWVFMAVSYDGKSATNDPTFYINGDKFVTQEIGLPPTGTYSDDGSQPIVFTGAFVGGGFNRANGTIDDIRIYNRILSDAEVRDIYNQSKQVKKVFIPAKKHFLKNL